MVTIRPIIRYNKKKCGDQTTCLECIKSCPYKILAYKPSEIPELGKPPLDWVITSTCRVMCAFPSCNLCIEACPNDALSIKIPRR